MRTTYDLRLVKDQLQLGRDLSPLIESFLDDGKGHEVPSGRVWNALEDLRRHLEVTQMDQLGRAPTEASVLGKMLARMGGAQGEVRLNPTAEDVIFLRGQKEGMRQLLTAICDHVGAALSAAAQARVKQESGEKRFQNHRPGQSPM